MIGIFNFYNTNSTIQLFPTSQPPATLTTPRESEGKEIWRLMEESAEVPMLDLQVDGLDPSLSDLLHTLSRKPRGAAVLKVGSNLKVELTLKGN